MSSLIANIFLLDHDEQPKGSLLSVSSFASKSNKSRLRSGLSVQSQAESNFSIPSKQSSIFSVPTQQPWISEVLLLTKEKQPKVSLLRLSKTTPRGRACGNIRSRILSVRSASPNFRESDHRRNNVSEIEVDKRNEVDVVKCTMTDGSPQDKQRETETDFESNFERDKAELIFAKGNGEKAKKDKDSKIKEMLCAPSPNLSTVAEKIQATNYAAETDLYPEDQEFALEEEVLMEGRELTLEDFRKLEDQSQEISLPGQICMRRSRSSSRTRGGDRVHRIESSKHDNRNSGSVTSDKTDRCGDEQGRMGSNRGRSNTRYARSDGRETGTIARRNRSSSRTRGGFNEALEAMSYSQKSSKQNNIRVAAEIEHATSSPTSKPDNEVPKELKVGSGQAQSPESTGNKEGSSTGEEGPLVTTECNEVGITEDNRHSDAISPMEDINPGEQITLKSTPRGGSSSSLRSRCGNSVHSAGSLSLNNRKGSLGSDKMDLSGRGELASIEINRGRARTRSVPPDSLESSVIVCRNRSSSRTRGGNINTVEASVSCQTPSPAIETGHGDESPLDRETMPEGQEVTLDQFSKLSKTSASVHLMRRSTRRGRSSSRSRGGRSSCSSPDRTVSSSGEKQHEESSSDHIDSISNGQGKRTRGRVRSSSRASYGKNNLTSVAVSRRSRSSSRTRGGYNEVLETMSCHRIKPTTDASEIENDSPPNDDAFQPRPSLRNHYPSEHEEHLKDDASREVITPPRRGRSASRSGGWNNHSMVPSKKDRTKLRGAVSSVERKQLETHQTRAPRARSASLTRRVNVFEDYDQKQSTNVPTNVTAAELAITSKNPLTLGDNAHSVLSAAVTSYDGIYRDEKMLGMTSDRMARLRSRSNAILLGEEVGESMLGVTGQIQSDVNHIKSPPLSPRQQHGGRVSYNKAVGDVVIARSISVGSENYSAFHADTEKMALMRLNSPIHSRRSTVFAPDNQVEDKEVPIQHEKNENTRGAASSGLQMEIASQLIRDDNNINGGTALHADLLAKSGSKSGDKKIKYDEMSGSYYDDVSDNLESIYDAGSALDSSTLPSGSQSGRDDKSAETSITDITDCTDTSDITMEDLREEAAEMCGRTCHTLDASLGDFKKTRAYRILSMIGKKGANETIKVFQSIQKLQLSEIGGCVDKSFKCVVGVMDAECEKCESKTKSCTE